MGGWLDSGYKYTQKGWPRKLYLSLTYSKGSEKKRKNSTKIPREDGSTSTLLLLKKRAMMERREEEGGGGPVGLSLF